MQNNSSLHIESEESYLSSVGRTVSRSLLTFHTLESSLFSSTEKTTVNKTPLAFLSQDRNEPAH